MSTSDLKAQEYQFTNELIHEKSPYLLQHAHNPVNWYPWGEKAFQKAKEEDKPIFLSIGYSTCHWCHVMEEESFENVDIAKKLNENFISVKLDREERPDIDQIYMSFVMATTGSGGWPMSVFLTPDRKPFYGGTYFPPDDKYGRVGFHRVLDRISSAWKSEREDIERSGDSFIDYFETRLESKEESSFDKSAFTQSYRYFLSSYDSLHGGFGQAPKFPSAHNLSFLLRYYERYEDKEALEMVEKTLKQMADGGIYDHLGGGFHRYSVDREWFVSHFEKMLYDQAMLLNIYLEAYQLTKKDEYKVIAKGIADYVLRDMQSSEGGFYSAEDADSLDSDGNEKKEGAFYVWGSDEFENILPKEHVGIVKSYFGIEESGNVKSDPHGEFTNKNILYKAKKTEEISEEFNLTKEEVESIIEASKRILLKKRSDKPRPHLDDKIIVDWNSLMISGLSYAYQVLGDTRYKEASESAAEFILSKCIDKNEELFHRYRDGEAKIAGQLDDYSFFVYSLIRLYEATFNEKWLVESKKFLDKAIDLFWDEKHQAFFMTQKDGHEFLIVRPKEFHDGAIPSGNSFMLLNLIAMHKITHDEKYSSYFDKLSSSSSEQLKKNPVSFSQNLVAHDFYLGPSKEIVISGDLENELTKDFIKNIHDFFLPNKVLVLNQNSGIFGDFAPFIKDKEAIQGKPTAYLCENYICQLPTQDSQKLRELLTNS